MITPSYGLTATERVLPKLALDFTTGVLDPRVTVTRALNTATRVNSAGLIELINSNLPRFDYDSVTLASKGLLIEEARTNLVVNSSFAGTGGINPTSWLRFQGTDGAQATSTLAASGTSNAWTFTANVNRQAIYQVISVAANTTYYATVYVEQTSVIQAAGNVFSLAFLPAGATATYEVSTTTAGSRMRMKLVVGATAGTVQFRIGLGVGSNVTGTITLSCPQLEVGAFATSYIPTTTTSVTRNADVVSMTGTNFSSWYNASEGTISVLVSDLKNTAAAALASLDLGNTNRMTLNAVGGDVLFAVRLEAALQANISCGAYTSGQYQIVGAYKNNNFAAAANGNATTTDASGTIPTATKLSIGSYNTGNLTMTGYIKKLAYYPQRLVDNEVQAFSKG